MSLESWATAKFRAAAMPPVNRLVKLVVLTTVKQHSPVAQSIQAVTLHDLLVVPAPPLQGNLPELKLFNTDCSNDE
jgi:hypothetical protein